MNQVWSKEEFLFKLAEHNFGHMTFCDSVSKNLPFRRDLFI